MSWNIMKLGDLVEVLDTLRKPITKRDRVAGEYPYYGATGIVDWVNDYIFEEELVLIGEDGAKWESGEKTAFIVKGKYWVNNHAHVVKPDKNKLLNSWLEYYLYFIDLKPWVTGLTVPKLNQANLKTIPIPIPPLPVQKQVVEKLDAAFAEIDKAISVTEKNIGNAEALFLSALDNLVNEKSLGKKILIGEVCELFQGLAINKKTKHLLVEKSGKPLLRIKDLVNGNHEQYVDDNYFSEATNIEENDLIFTRTGSLGLVFRGRQGVLHNNSFKIVPSSDLIADYFFWWLHNPKFLAEIHKIAQKAAQPDISHKLFKSQSIRIPNKEKQRELASNIESIYQTKISYSSLMQKKLKLIANLKNSILNQAFSGELTKDAA